jgi:serine/tyrosine/threonine adenylyltransferase
MKLQWRSENTYKSLPTELYSLVQASDITKPELVLFNEPLANNLGLSVELSDIEKASLFSGNLLDERWTPLAQAYAGHQYGGFGILGDGRALLLTEIISPEGQRFDLQLKGSGRTPYSRGGDGKAALGPMLREYLISEAMAALSIPTTRSLAVVKTNEPVIREQKLQGAILTRVAKSHIRVGTFQWISQKGNPELQRTFFDYVMDRHFPDLKDQEDAAKKMLHRVIESQAKLIAKWQSVGFVHGVMNTDNMLISGETIDYGPCAFIDHYNPEAVFSSIDQYGRYAYHNQPNAALWNLTRFAETLLSLLDPNPEKAVKIAEEALATFAPVYYQEYYRLMGQKIGIHALTSEDYPLIDRLLELMQTHQADYTNTFLSLQQTFAAPSWFLEDDVKEWNSLWLKRISKEQDPYSLMKQVNPTIIPRNHLVESALSKAQEGDMTLFHSLLKALQQPFSIPSEDFQSPGPIDERFVTYCGT